MSKTKAEREAAKKKAVAAMRRKNREFAKMTKAQQRVAIAQDVIAALAARKILATRGTYFDANLTKADPNEQLCEALADKTCNVCAIGAVFVAAVKRADKLPLRDVASVDRPCKWDERRGEWVETGKEYVEDVDIYDNQMIDYLAPWFSEQTMREMEAAFEHYDDNKASEQMVLIMKNIIRNRGEFKIDEMTTFEDGGENEHNRTFY